MIAEPQNTQNPKMNRRQRSAEIPSWTCLARPIHKHRALCGTHNDAGMRHCAECGCAWWVSSEHGSKYCPPITAVEKHEMIDDLCARHNDATDRIRDIFDLAHSVNVETGYGAGFPTDEKALEKVITENARALWTKIIRESSVERVMSRRRKEEFRNQLEAGEFPHPDADTVRATIHGWRSAMPGYLREVLEDVFSFLTPGQSWKQYKSNNGVFIGPRVVLTWQCEQSWGGGFRLNYHARDYWQDLDNIFHLYGGRGFATEEKDSALLPILDRAMADARIDTAESLFFRVRWFKNGNMHVFPDAEIAARINADMLADRLPTCEIPNF